VEPDPVPPKTLVGDFKRLYTDVDMGAIPGDSTVSCKATDLQFHKAFFAAHSKSLSQSFQPVSSGEEQTTEMLKVKNLLSTADAFRAILKYLYYGDLSGLNVLAACEVQEFAKTHGMNELQQICEFVMAVNINVESCMSIMKVVFHPGNIKRPELAEIRKNTLTFFRENIVDINLSLPALMMNGPIVMAEIILAWQVAEQAKAEGIRPEDVLQKRNLNAARRYSEILQQAEDSNSSGHASSSHAGHGHASGHASHSHLNQAESKDEKPEEPEKEIKKQTSSMSSKEKESQKEKEKEKEKAEREKKNEKKNEKEKEKDTKKKGKDKK